MGNIDKNETNTLINGVMQIPRQGLNLPLCESVTCSQINHNQVDNKDIIP